jgi:hypothetical protein
MLPAALRFGLAAVALAGVAWALLVPAWQVPDEDAHFAYVQTLAELHRLPADDGRPAEGAEKSAEQDLAERASGFLRSYQRPEADPSWSEAAEARWLAEQTGAPRDDGGGASAARANPPGYYLYALPAYWVAGGTVIDRLYAMRLWTIPLALVFAAGAWLLAGELLGRDRPLQLVAAMVAGLWPMASFLTAAVTPDALVLATWSLWFWLAARTLRAPAGATIAGLLVVTVAAVAAKPASVALGVGTAWVLGVLLWRRGGRPAPRPRTVALAFAGVAVLAAAAVAAVAPGSPRQLASYLWQFYLPELPGMQHIAQLPAWPAWDRWVEGTAGAFGWLEVRFPLWVYVLFAVLAVAVLVGAARTLRPRPAVAVAFALPAVALVAGLHLTEHWFLVDEGKAFTQGRYLLPLLPLAGVAVAAAVARRPALQGAVLGLMCTWQLAALALVLGRFYA